MKDYRRYVVGGLAVVLLLAAAAVGLRAMGRLRERRSVRPTVCDRTGRVLLRDGRETWFAPVKRRADRGGEFAAGLLGYTAVREGARTGVSGVEFLIDRNGVTAEKLLLALDAGIQTECEALLERLVPVLAPEYAYVTVVGSDGGLIAAAQRPVLDLDRRGRTGAAGMVFMASTYIFPVSDEWMRLLGSASGAPPEERKKFRFDRKLGIFPGEGQGRIAASAQSATALNYLLAYAGAAGKRDIPELKVFLPGGAALPPLRPAAPARWRSLLWSRDGSTFSALGEVPVDGGETLYVLLRAVCRKEDVKEASPERRASAEKAVAESFSPRPSEAR